MSEKTLRRAATHLRADAFNGQTDDAPFLEAVANWLDACAQFLEDEPDYTHDGEDYALTVARAYLGEAS